MASDFYSMPLVNMKKKKGLAGMSCTESMMCFCCRKQILIWKLVCQKEIFIFQPSTAVLAMSRREKCGLASLLGARNVCS
jgi:hypothetical protein